MTKKMCIGGFRSILSGNNTGFFRASFVEKKIFGTYVLVSKYINVSISFDDNDQPNPLSNTII